MPFTAVGNCIEASMIIQLFVDVLSMTLNCCFVRDPQSMVSSLRVDVANGKANRLITGLERFERFDSSSTHHTFYEGS